MRVNCSSRIACHAGALPHRQFERQRDVVGLGQRQARHVFGLSPHPFEPRERRLGLRDVAQRREPGRLQARGRRRLPGRPAGPVPAAAQLGRARRTGGSPVGLTRIAQDPLDVLLVGFERQRPQCEVDDAGGWRAARRRRWRIEHLFPQRDPRGSPRQRVVDLGQAGGEVLHARQVELEPAVADAVAGRQHEARRRQSSRGRHVGAAFREADGERAEAVGQAERDLQLLIPDEPAPRIGIALDEGEARDASVLEAQARS